MPEQTREEKIRELLEARNLCMVGEDIYRAKHHGDWMSDNALLNAYGKQVGVLMLDIAAAMGASEEREVMPFISFDDICIRLACLNDAAEATTLVRSTLEELIKLGVVEKASRCQVLRSQTTEGALIKQIFGRKRPTV